ncbi:MAG: hypothetical protein AMS25_02135 [Gemmatimonas sp. SM23_52]|nr:MAG: hypothetical protein AMS25_02135 [Gemmatimonas sp. SM23_52]
MKRAKPSWLARIAVLALAVSVFVACDEDETGPSLSDTGASVSSVINQFMTQNEGLESLEFFGAYIADVLAPVAPVGPALVPESHTIAGLTKGIRASLDKLRAPRATIPPDFLGVTFVYDPGQSAYVPSERMGAPETGVRFILYDNPSELNEIGYLDFIDESDFGAQPAVIDVWLEVFLTGVGTVLDYTITGTAMEGSGDLTFDGYLSDGTETLFFEFVFAAEDATAWDATFTLTFENLSLALELSELPNGSQSITITIEDSDNDNSIVFDISVDEMGEVQAGSGITVNDVLVAIISGNVDDDTVTITNAEGDPLTNEEINALAQIFAGLLGAFIVMQHIFAFGIGLIGLSFFV